MSEVKRINYPIVKETKISLQPVVLGRGTDYTGKPVMAAEAWQFGVKKTRQCKRAQEIPPLDVSLENLPELYDWVEVLPVIRAYDINTAKKLLSSGNSPDAYVVSSCTTEEAGALFAVLAEKQIPIIPNWGSWGFSWNARFTLSWAEELGFKSIATRSEKDVDSLLKALRALRHLHNTKILYIGSIPSHSVNAVTRPLELYQKFGVDFQQIDFNEYINAVKTQMTSPENIELAEQWRKNFDVKDERNEHMEKYTAIYLALHQLLGSYDANALTMDCAFLPDIDLVPCVAASFLLDDGVVFSCEGDINQLISLTMLMGLSQTSGMMGNLFENAIYADLQKNVIVINHDVMPPSMTCKNCQMQFYDFHDSRKGSTCIGELPQEDVTMDGLNHNGTRFWYSTGKVKWVENTVHCRIAVGIEVNNAMDILFDSRGHHQVFVYGDFLSPLELLAKFMNLKTLKL